MWESPAAMCFWSPSADVHQPLDLQIGICKMVVAGPKATANQDYKELSAVRIATKYPRITTEYFTRRGVPVEIIPLSGSVELAPLLGLSDRIVDLVSTGRTLAENGLEIIEPNCRYLGPPHRQPSQLPDQTQESY